MANWKLFGPRQLLNPVSRFVHYKTTQVMLKCAIQDFHLAVRLWVIGRALAESGVLLLKEDNP